MTRAMTSRPPQQAAALPERIRPSWLGFGSLADGFLPFDLRQDADDNRGGGAAAAAASIRMASLVMKVRNGLMAWRLFAERYMLYVVTPSVGAALRCRPVA